MSQTQTLSAALRVLVIEGFRLTPEQSLLMHWNTQCCAGYNTSHYLCGPQGGIPAARVDASGTRHPPGFQPPCYLAHNQRDHPRCRGRNRPSLCLQSPNQCRGRSTGDFVVYFLFITAERFTSTDWGWKQEIKDCTCTHKWQQEIQPTGVREPQKCSTCKGYETVVTLIIWPGTKGSSSAAVSWLGDIAAGLYG